MSENCEQCDQVLAKPKHDWSGALIGGDVARDFIGTKVTRWECPECGSQWRLTEKTSSGELTWSRPG